MPTLRQAQDHQVPSSDRQVLALDRALAMFDKIIRVTASYTIRGDQVHAPVIAIEKMVNGVVPHHVGYADRDGLRWHRTTFERDTDIFALCASRTAARAYGQASDFIAQAPRWAKGILTDPRFAPKPDHEVQFSAVYSVDVIGSGPESGPTARLSEGGMRLSNHYPLEWWDVFNRHADDPLNQLWPAGACLALKLDRLNGTLRPHYYAEDPDGVVAGQWFKKLMASHKDALLDLFAPTAPEPTASL